MISPDVLGQSVASHATMPTPMLFGERIRVFLSGRDEQGRSLPMWVDLDAHDLSVVGRSATTILPLGDPGTFDEDGVMPSSVLQRDDGTVLLYYVGWNRSSGSVPYRVAIGCASSPDGDRFHRVSRGPVLDRTIDDPIFVTTPFVATNPWTMWYSTCTRWEVVEGRLEPYYELAVATSPDGKRWSSIGSVKTNLAADATTRPALFEGRGGTKIAFCHRQAAGYRTRASSSYRLGVGSVESGRVDVIVEDLLIDDDGFSSMMRCYPTVIAIGDRLLMLYNGDGFGRTGVGAAWIHDAVKGWRW